MTAPPASLSVAVKYSDKKTDAWASVYGLAAGQHMLVLMQHLNQSPYYSVTCGEASQTRSFS
ncbi:hypothetical protein NX009_06830 [Klebsiella pneumoniae]|nr:hypothetical protein [Klebsiella pneumoniae]